MVRNLLIMVGLIFASILQAGEPLAFVGCGVSRIDKQPAGNFIRDYAQFAIDAGPILKANGWKRLFYHNPGGVYPIAYYPQATSWHVPTEDAARALGIDVRYMLINQWQLAEQVNMPFANRKKLKLGHQILTEHYGLEEVVYYLGDPTQLKDPYRDGLECVEPFINLGDNASLGFDMLGFNEHGHYQTGKIKQAVELCEELIDKGHKVYLEPRPSAERADIWIKDKTVSGTTATFDRDMASTETKQQFSTATTFGDVLRQADVTGTRPDGSEIESDTTQWPKYVSPIYRGWRTKKAAEVKGTR